MNSDHAGTMVEMVTGLCGFTPSSAAMIDVDRTGFLLQTRGPDQLVHLSFGREVTGDELRHAIIGVLKRAREATTATTATTTTTTATR